MNNYAYRWLTVAIGFLSVGGFFALIIGLARTPLISEYLPPDFFTYALTAHVNFAIVMFLLSFAVVLWSYNFNIKGIKASYAIALTGALLILYAAVSAKGETAVNNYVPTIVDPFFFVGLTLFFVAIVINLFSFFTAAKENIFSQDIIKSLTSLSVFIAVLMSVSVFTSLARQTVPAEHLLYYEKIFWVPGHIQQVLNGTMLITVWYMLRKIIDPDFVIILTPLQKGLNYLLIISSVILLFVSLTIDTISLASRIVSESVYGIGLGGAIIIHGYYVLKGLKPNFKDFSYISLIFSMVICYSGFMIAYGGFGSDLRVPAHYHGAVTGLTLAIMGLSYNLLKEKFKNFSPDKTARIQTMLYGVGMFIFMLGLFFSGLFGAPRKTHGTGFTDNPLVLYALGLMGIGVLLAVISGIIYVCYIAITLNNKEINK